MGDVNDQLERWADVGAQIGHAREAIRPRRSKRAAAKAARISEAQWRHIEAGRRLVGGVTIPPAVSPQVLEDAALSVGLDPAPLFDRLGWTYEGTGQPAPLDVNRRLDQIETEQREIRALVEQIRDALPSGPQREGQ
jgi:hypothetical protein